MASTSVVTATVTKGLLVRLHARPEKEAEVERFLTDARSLVEQEPATTAWFAVRFGRAEYGIFDVFPDEQGRDAHLNGAVAGGLTQRGDELFAESPAIERIDVLADKLPASAPGAAIHKALLLTFAPKSQSGAAVTDFLRGGRQLVDEEPGTLAWFAIQLEDGRYGIFDVFPDNRARLAHLAGRVPRELAKHALSLLGSIPDMDKCDVLAVKLGR
jgi:quinol monooxygenase YgiN